MLLARAKEYLHLPIPDPLYVVLGSVAGNMLPGVPLWVMLVGPPGDGKTEMLNVIKGVPKIHWADELENKSAFLSATSDKDRVDGATGGLLASIGRHGMLVSKDFTSVLDLKKDDLKMIMSTLRHVYDGEWARPKGTDGGKTLTWKGSVGYLAGCTPAVDQYWSLGALMGERWMYYRSAPGNGWEKSRRALCRSEAAWRKDLQGLVSFFFHELGLGFRRDRDEWPSDGSAPELYEIDDQELIRLISIAELAVRARSYVPREHYGDREVIGIAGDFAESPQRVAQALGQLYKGLRVIGVSAQGAWRIIRKVGLDSIPQVRRKILELAWDMDKGKLGMTVEAVRGALGLGDKTARSAIEDLCIHGLLEGVARQGGGVGSGAGRPGREYKTTEWTRKRLRMGWGWSK